MEVVAELIKSGGAVALAVVIWAELRLFRKAMSDAMGTIVTKQTQILERQDNLATTIDGRARLREVGFGLRGDH